MHRFLVPLDSFDGDSVTLPPAAGRQLARVLRCRAGDQIVVFDGSGWEYVVTLTAVHPEDARGRVVQRRANDTEPRVSITLYQGMLKADRFELVLQKGTELGVAAFVPILSSRSVAKGRQGGRSEHRQARWRKIIVEAAEQSGRARVPTLANPIAFSTACDEIQGPAIIPWERESSTGLKTELGRLRERVEAGQPLGIFVGSEGGFTPEEACHARSAGIVPVSLGSRILRSETAGIAVVAAAMFFLDELGG